MSYRGKIEIKRVFEMHVQGETVFVRGKSQANLFMWSIVGGLQVCSASTSNEEIQHSLTSEERAQIARECMAAVMNVPQPG